ncbi:FadR/GntR family transcriptional regulator [Ottowia thiooxydans]|uniref:FadR/GntR family transcriptional regulator n=1 Tax=Ottowia thiooxydans TaxID=219182 RepID=UPI000403A46B|nr:FCD domain-containing protein [Ottowia thiooxydans]
MRTTDEAAEKVRALLFNGALHPGDRLPSERELSTLLGISRSALREALRALVTGGLLETRLGKYGGTFITAGKASVVSGAMSDLLRLSSVSISELFEARQWIQGALIPAACERLTEAQIDALEDNVNQSAAAHAEGRSEDRIRINVEFHNMLAESAGNTVAVIVVRGLTQAWQELMAEVGSDQVSGGVAFRRELIKALRARDEEGATKALSKILRTSESLYKELAKRRAQELISSAQSNPAIKRSKATANAFKT